MYGLCKQSIKAMWQQVLVLHRRVDLNVLLFLGDVLSCVRLGKQ